MHLCDVYKIRTQTNTYYIYACILQVHYICEVIPYVHYKQAQNRIEGRMKNGNGNTDIFYFLSKSLKNYLARITGLEFRLSH